MTQNRRTMHPGRALVALALAATLAPTQALAQAVERRADGVVVRPADTRAADVRLQLVSDRIVRVSADPKGGFQRSPSLMRAAPPSPPPAFELEEDASRVRLKAPGITAEVALAEDRKSTRLNSSHVKISYAVFCLKKKN